MFGSPVEGKAEKFARWGHWLGWPPPFRGRALGALLQHAEWALARLHLLTVLEGKDRAAAAQVETALEYVVDPGVRSVLVDLVLDGQAGDALVSLVERAGYRHSDLGRHLLYLALQGRLDDCRALDPGLGTLRSRFRSAPAALQARIRQALTRTAGPEAERLLVEGGRQTVLGELTLREANLLVRLAASRGNWEVLFRCLWVLPAGALARAVRAMRDEGWSPREPERADLLAHLAALVEETGPVPESDEACPAPGPLLQGWWARGEAWERSGAPQEDWRRCLDEAADPADHVAALAALRQRGSLDHGTLRQAGRSPHWPVRLVAAALGGQVDPQDPGGRLWLERLAPLVSVEALWAGRPCDLVRGGLEALQEGLAGLSDRRAAGGLLLVEAVYTHYAGRQPEIDSGLVVVVQEETLTVKGLDL